MSLLTSPNVASLLDDICGNAGLSSSGDQGELDRFFWLRAQRSQDGRLSITPTYEMGETDRQNAAHDGPPVRLCNLVLQGGGTLGLAHAGFVAGLECAGIRFAGLAGTSAGSILAMGIAGIRGDDIMRETYPKLVQITDTVPMDHFIDGPRPIRVLIKRALKGHPILMPQHWGGVISALLRLRDRRGLNHGTAFEKWLEGVLSELGCATIADLYQALDRIWDDLSDLTKLRPHGKQGEPTLRVPPEQDEALNTHPGAVLLQLITMAMPVGLKFQLPQDLLYLSPEYQAISPARLVRTSMSIPGFFEPVVMQTNKQTWRHRVASDISGLLSADQEKQFSELEDLVFLDGGMMSNLPSDSFRDVMPEVPTIVVPLVGGGAKKEMTRRRKMSDLGSDIAACASAVRLQRDREIWAQNASLRSAFDHAEQTSQAVKRKKRTARRYPVATAPIDVGDANWLNFVMSEAEKASLFEAGLSRARDLLLDLKKGEHA